MEEKHHLEQFFFDKATTSILAEFFQGYKDPCILCAPTVAKALYKKGKTVTLLDIDERFSYLPGFKQYDITKPLIFEKKFDVIFCDPPFFNYRFSILLKAIDTLSHHNYNQPLVISYLVRRENKFLKYFQKYRLSPTTFYPKYDTVKKSEKNLIKFYANFDFRIK